MQELELTWSQVIRIWWAAFWRWLVLANLATVLYGGVIGIALLILGHRNWGEWFLNGIFVVSAPAAILAFRLALKVPYKGFRIVIVAKELE
jgi:hypothetical protein